MLTRSRFNAKFTRKLNRRKSRIELVSDFFFTFSFPKRYAKACRRLDRRTIERTYEDWSSVFNPETYARTKEIGSQAVMNRVFAKNDEDVTLVFGVSRRDGSSGKIYQASRCPSLFLLPFRGCVYETADHSLVLVSLHPVHGRNLFRTNYRHRTNSRFQKIPFVLPVSFSTWSTHDRENPLFPVLTNIWLIRNKYSLRTNFSMTLRSIFSVFSSSNFFSFPSNHLPLEKKRKREKSTPFSFYMEVLYAERKRDD